MTEHNLKQLADLHVEITELKKEIERMKADRGWISINDKSFDKLDDFMILFENGCIRRYSETYYPVSPITHWMPLPKEPKQ